MLKYPENHDFLAGLIFKNRSTRWTPQLLGELPWSLKVGHLVTFVDITHTSKPGIMDQVLRS